MSNAPVTAPIINRTPRPLPLQQYPLSRTAATNGNTPAPAPTPQPAAPFIPAPAVPAAPGAVPAPAASSLAEGLVVVTEGLTRTYNGVNAVDGLNLSVPAGASTASWVPTAPASPPR